MNDRERETAPGPPAGAATEEEMQVSRMLGRAGARGAAPAEDLESVRAAARSAWQARYAGNGSAERRFRWAPFAAAAALAALSFGVWWGLRSGLSPGRVVATVEQLHGEARLGAGGETASRTLGVGATIAQGARVETGATGRAASRMALRLESGASLRLDAGTRLSFEAADRVRLERGAIYFQSVEGVSPTATAIEVATSAGSFRDVGTQFEVRIDSARGSVAGEEIVRLRVREGSVAFASGARTASPPLVAGRGEELTIAANGDVARGTIAANDAGWGWVGESAPLPDIEGMTARRFLEWLAREEGLVLEFADAEAERIAGSVKLHGSIAGLSLADAPGAVLASCGLSHEIAGGRLRVSVRTAS